MKLSVPLQLLPNADQKKSLLKTMECFNEAACFAARVGWENGISSRFPLHRIAYREIRNRFNLSAQLTVFAIAKAADCLFRNEAKCPVIKPRSAVCYDRRILSFKGHSVVSLWSLGGRMTVPFVCGDYQRSRQGRIKGQADLVYRQGKFYLLCTIEMPEDAPVKPVDVIGVDLGVVNIATDSTGEIFSGSQVERVRRHYVRRRSELDRIGTKSARRRLRKIRNREANFRRNENHRISKLIVAKAKATNSAIALEDLKGIRDRVSVRKPQRDRLFTWSFGQMRTFLDYKSRLAGIPIVLVDPRNTSRTCSDCGYCHKSNRRSQAEFVCRHCGFSANADQNAAWNIRAKALVKMPMVGDVEAKTGNRNAAESTYKPSGNPDGA